MKNKSTKKITQKIFLERCSKHASFFNYDFSLPDLKTVIEFDGEQHFKPVRFGGQSLYLAKKQFKKIALYDTIKLCNVYLMGLKIIRISYHHFDKISEILDKELYNNSSRVIIYNNKGRTTL